MKQQRKKPDIFNCVTYSKHSVSTPTKPKNNSQVEVSHHRHTAPYQITLPAFSSANVLTAALAEKWKRITNLKSTLLLLCTKRCRLKCVENSERARECTCKFGCFFSSAETIVAWLHFFFFVFLFERFRIRIDFNIRKFGVTSQDKRQCKQIDVPSKRMNRSFSLLLHIFWSVCCLWA